MHCDLILRIEQERQRTDHRKLLRLWLKPLIKRQADTWVCTGRGTTATGLSPQTAYSVWLMAQSESTIYAAKAAAYDRALRVRQC